MTRQYQNGWDAASHGWRFDQCPYKIPSTKLLAVEWKAGWQAYHQQQRAA